MHYVLENGLLMEFKKENLNKPVEVLRLENSQVKDGKLLTGENNTIAVFTSKKNPIFLRAATNTSYIEWLSAISSHCSNDNLQFDTSLASAL